MDDFVDLSQNSMDLDNAEVEIPCAQPNQGQEEEACPVSPQQRYNEYSSELDFLSARRRHAEETQKTLQQQLDKVTKEMNLLTGRMLFIRMQQRKLNVNI